MALLMVPYCLFLRKAKITRLLTFYRNINDGTPIVMFDRIADGVDCDKVIVF
jgi:hypothetical protein